MAAFASYGTSEVQGSSGLSTPDGQQTYTINYKEGGGYSISVDGGGEYNVSISESGITVSGYSSGPLILVSGEGQELTFNKDVVSGLQITGMVVYLLGTGNWIVCYDNWDTTNETDPRIVIGTTGTVVLGETVIIPNNKYKQEVVTLYVWESTKCFFKNSVKKIAIYSYNGSYKWTFGLAEKQGEIPQGDTANIIMDRTSDPKQFGTQEYTKGPMNSLEIHYELYNQKEVDRFIVELQKIAGKIKNQPAPVANIFKFVRDGTFVEDPEQAGKYSYTGSTDITEIVLPPGITALSDDIFVGCNKLTSITIPKTVTEIGDRAFKNCKKLATVTFEAGGTEGLAIGEEAFYGTILKTVELPSRVSVLEDGSFGYIRSLKTVSFESAEPGEYKLTTIGEPFINSINLKTLTIPVTNLKDIRGSFIPKNITSYTQIGETSLITEDGGITYAEASDKSLFILRVGEVSGVVSFKEGLKAIPGMFSGSEITKITVPKSVESIATNAFQNSKSLTEVIIPEDSALKTIGERAFNGSGVKSITLPGSLTSVGDNAFYLCGSLESVIIKSSELSLGNGTFQDCRKLVTITFENGNCVLSIGPGCFKGVAATSITLPSGTSAIGAGAFSGSSLSSLNIPASVTSIGVDSYNPLLPDTVSKITVEVGNANYYVKDNILYERLGGGNSRLLFIPASSVDVVIDETVTQIGPNVFKNLRDLQTLTLGSGFSADIADRMFTGLTSLRSFDAGAASFTGIGASAFEGLYVESVKIPVTVTSIGKEAFRGCLSLYAFQIGPESGSVSASKLVSVGNGAFQGCAVKSISLPDTVSSAGGMELNKAFSGCGSLSELTIVGTGSSMKGDYSSISDSLLIRGGNTLDLAVSNVPERNGIRTIAIPDSVTVLDPAALRYSVFDRFEVGGSNPSFSIHEGALMDKAKTKLLWIPSGMGELSLPATVVQIGESGWNIFDYSPELESVSLVDKSGTGDLVFYGSNNSSPHIITIDAPNRDLQFYGFVNAKDLESLSVTVRSFEQKSDFSIGGSDADVSISVTGLLSLKNLSKSINSLIINKTGLTIDDMNGWFGIGRFSPERIVLNGEELNIPEALTGHKLTVNTEIEGLSFKIDSVEKIRDGGAYKATVRFSPVSDEGLTAYDLEGDGLIIRGGSFQITMSEDTEVTVREAAGGERRTVTFDPCGGNLSEPLKELTVNSGLTIRQYQIDERSEAVSRKGYTFKGWYEDASLSKIYSGGIVTEDKTLYARWSLDSGFRVTYDDPNGLVSAQYQDGRKYYSGENVSNGENLTFTLKVGNGVELLGWKVGSSGNWSDRDAGELEIVISGDTSIIPNIRYYATSNSLINITDLPTPEGENIYIIWEKQFDIDTSMMTWTGFPSIPVIVDDYVYVRASDELVKISLDSGDVVKKVKCGKTPVAFYHYLGYGGGYIIDYMTQAAYDLDLEKVGQLPGDKQFTAVNYNDGYFYGIADGKLWKFKAGDWSLDTTGGWNGGVDVSWHGIYGTTSTPVFLNGWLYFIEITGSDGNGRSIGGVKLDTGEKIQVDMPRLNGYMLDDGWITHYQHKDTDYLFVTGYTSGLFEDGTSGSRVVCVPLTSEGRFGGEELQRYIEFELGGTASAFVVIDGRGYVNVTKTNSNEEELIPSGATAAFYVVDVKKFLETDIKFWDGGEVKYHSPKIVNESGISVTNPNYAHDIGSKDPWKEFFYDGITTKPDATGNTESAGGFIIYAEASVQSHGSIVASTAYKDSTGKVYIYLLPYSSGDQALYTFTDWEGKNEAGEYLKSSPVGMNFGSQAVRVGMNGELVWYTDSGTLWCVRPVSMMPFQFLIQDSEGVEWVDAYGKTLEEALATAIKSHYNDHVDIYGNLIVDGIKVGGITPSVYYQQNGIWNAVDLKNSSLNEFRSFFVSFTVTTDAGEPLDLNKLSGTYYLNEDGKVTEHSLFDLLEGSPIDGFFTVTGYHTVAVDADGGILAEGTPASVSLIDGGEYTLPAAPTRTNYNFVGWDVEGTIMNAGDKVTVTGDMTVKAIWEWANKSQAVAGVTITTDDKDSGFVSEPSPGKWVTITGAGYAEKSSDAYALIHAAKPDFTNDSDVADRTMFLVFGQKGTVTGDRIEGRLFLSDGTQIYSEGLSSTTKLWYITLSSTPNASGSKVLSDSYKPGETYTMAVYVNGTLACSADITVPDGNVPDITVKGSSITMGEGDSVNLKPQFYVLKNGQCVIGNVAQAGVTWVSSDETVVTVGADGSVRAVSAGTAVITLITDDGGHRAYCHVTVEPTPVEKVTITNGASATMKIGDSLVLEADYGSASASVQWASSNPLVANVDSDGRVVGISAGTAAITATVTDSLGNTKTATCVVTVSPVPVTSITMQGSLSLDVGDSRVLTATVSADASNRNVVWSSSNPSVVSVVNGVVTAVSAGTAVVTATAADGSGVSASCTVTVNSLAVESVEITPSSVSLEVGKSTVLKVEITPGNALNKNVVWMSSDSTVATVNNGVVTALKPGTATITVSTVDGGKTDTCRVTVKGDIQGITLDRSSLSIEEGGTATLAYELSPADATGYTVRWTSSDTKVVTVSGGKITAVGPGTATVTASVDGTKLSAVCTVTVVGEPQKVGETERTENQDGSVTEKVTEAIDTGGGHKVTKVTETTSKDDRVSSTTTTYTIGEGSRVTTTLVTETDAAGNSSIEAVTKVPSTVSNGVRSVTAADMREALRQIDTASAIMGRDVSSEVSIDVSSDADVSEVVATIPSDSLGDMSGSGMELVTDVGALNFGSSVVGSMADIGGDAVVSVSKVSGTALPSSLEGKVGVAAFEVSLTVGNTKVHQLGGTVTMTLPYELSDG